MNAPGESTPKGTFTHTWGAQSLSVGGYRRVGRWPGVVHLWDKLMERHGHRVRPPWEWFLHGKRVYVETSYPSAKVTGWDLDIAADDVQSMGLTFEATAGPFLEAMFGTGAPDDSEGDE